MSKEFDPDKYLIEDQFDPDSYLSEGQDAIEKQETGALEAGLRGTAQGATFGFADELTGAGEAVYEALTGEDQIKDIIENYQKYRDESREEYKKAEEDQGAAFLAGELAGGIGTSLLTGGAALPSVGRTAAKQALKAGATKGAAKLAAGKALASQAAKQGAAMGAAYGAGESEADLTEGELKDFTKDVALSTGLGAVMGGISPTVSKGLEKGARLVGKGASKLSKEALRRTADVDEDIFKRVTKNPKQVREADDIIKSPEQLANEGNRVLNEAIELSQSAKEQLSDDIKYAKSFLASTFKNVLDELNPADRQSRRQLLNLKDDILNIKLKNKEMLSDKDLQEILDDIYEIAYTGLKKDAADSTKKAIRKVGNQISQTLKEDNPAYKNFMAESEKRFKFVTDLSDMYGMNRAGIDATEDFVEGSALKFTQKLDFPKRKTDTAITNLKKVIDTNKVDDKNFIENAVKNGFISKDFATTNEARAIKDLLSKDTSLKVGDLMSARALIGSVAGAYTGTFLPYAAAVFSKPAARKLMMNMDRLGIKKGTEAADKYLEKLITTGTLSRAMMDVKDEVEENAIDRRKELSDRLSNIKEGDLVYVADSVKEKNSSLYNQIMAINSKNNKIKNGYVNMLLSDPVNRKLIKEGLDDLESSDVISDDSMESDDKKKVDDIDVGRSPQSVGNNFLKYKNKVKKVEKGGTSFTGAKGKYQFIKSTADLLNKKYKTNFDRDTEKGQEGLMDLLIKDNTKLLKKAGVDVNDTSLYMAHNIGHYAASKLIKDDSEKKSIEILKNSPTLWKSNPSFFFKKEDGSTKLSGSDIKKILNILSSSENIESDLKNIGYVPMTSKETVKKYKRFLE